MTHKHKLVGAFFINALIVVFEIIALILSLRDQGLDSFFFYTQDSNYLAMAVSLLFCVCSAKAIRGQGELPAWLHPLRYISVSCLMLTFFVVLFVLMPAMGADGPLMLYRGSMLYQHTLCPILSVVSFFVLEPDSKLSKSDIKKALLPTLLYAGVAILLNLARVIEGPYFFLMVYAQPWYMSVLWCGIVLGIAWLLAAAVWKLHNVIYQKSAPVRS